MAGNSGDRIGSVSARPVILLLSVAALLVAGLSCGPSEDIYTARNLTLFLYMPVYPGAERIEVTQSPYFEEQGPLSRKPVGWVSAMSFRAPAGTTADEVLDFYIAEWGMWWTVQEYKAPGIDLPTGEPTAPHRMLTFESGTARVSFETDNLEQLGTFTITSDHRSRRE